jgi:iduronate 2-sulfatase
MVDDLRSQLGCYGHNDTVRTPNVDRLAKTGTIFQHAYVQIAVCGPSRSSFLTGLRPAQQNVLNFVSDFRRATPNGSSIVTLPQFFKGHGMLSTGMGKTYHPNMPKSYDEPFSWSPDFPYVTAPKGSSGCGGGTSPWCSDNSTNDPNMYADGVIVSEAIRQLSVIVSNYSVPSASPPPPPPPSTDEGGTTDAAKHTDTFDNPLSRAFFMAVGLHRPHMDWKTPPEFLAKQPPAPEIKLAVHQLFPNTTTPWAFYNCTELTGRKRLQDVHAHIEPEMPLAADLAQHIRRNYYAAVEYMDSQVGSLHCSFVASVLW